MSPSKLLAVVTVYFLILLLVAYLSSRKADNSAFFIGNRSSNWMLVAFGMIGTTLSGITFVSVPGDVGANAFAYMQLTLGYFIGYIIVAYLLLPLYYKLHVTSIYTYLNSRLGFHAYLTGATFFMISRTLGATARLYLVINILQTTILDAFGCPFWLTTFIILLMILLYTFKGGVKTIIWTDTLQTFCMLGGLIVCSLYIMDVMGFSILSAYHAMEAEGLSSIFVTDSNSKLYFGKQIVAGIFITIAMTGLDQEVMQKSISVKTLKDAQKNILSLAVILSIVLFLFLLLGALLSLYAKKIGVQVSGDALFPLLAVEHMPPTIAIIFIIALISALFPSADGAITALTSSFCIDIIGIDRKNKDEQWRIRTRKWVHLSFAFVFLVLIMIFKAIASQSMIGVILKLAAYTYGPLLGLFAFGILTKRTIQQVYTPFICIAALAISYLIDSQQAFIFGDFKIGLELLLINGLIVFGGLWLISDAKQLGQTE